MDIKKTLKMGKQTKRLPKGTPYNIIYEFDIQGKPKKAPKLIIQFFKD